jgi:hypothetical protein
VFANVISQGALPPAPVKVNPAIGAGVSGSSFWQLYNPNIEIINNDAIELIK